MKRLPLTLIGYSTKKPEQTFEVMDYCKQFFEFEKSILVCNELSVWSNGIEVHIVDESGYLAAMKWEVGGINKYVKTKHSLFVSSDGWILNPQAWKDEWLEYDLIGAPWPTTLVDDPRYRVGNTGFCLRSKDFLEASAEYAHMYDGVQGGDVFTCQTMRPIFERMGIQYAPIDVAADFSWEFNIAEYPNGRSDAFGFHGITNNKKLPKIGANHSNP